MAEDVLSIQTTVPGVPRLELRQAVAAAPVANPAAPAAQPAGAAAAPVGGGAAAPVNPAAPAAVNPAPAAANPAAPAAGQPVTTPPTQANPVTQVMENTVVGGVTKQVPVMFTQTFANSLTSVEPVQSGSIGMGTLTGSIGVVKSSTAKGGAERTIGMGGWSTTLALVAGGVVMGMLRVFAF